MTATTETTELTYESTSRMVSTRRWTIHINEAGTQHDEAIFLLHGSGPGATGWSNFSQNIPALAEHYRVIAVDMPGWGESDPVTWQERDHSTALLDLMDAWRSSGRRSSATRWVAARRCASATSTPSGSTASSPWVPPPAPRRSWGRPA